MGSSVDYYQLPLWLCVRCHGWRQKGGVGPPLTTPYGIGLAFPEVIKNIYKVCVDIVFTLNGTSINKNGVCGPSSLGSHIFAKCHFGQQCCIIYIFHHKSTIYVACLLVLKVNGIPSQFPLTKLTIKTKNLFNHLKRRRPAQHAEGRAVRRQRQQQAEPKETTLTSIRLLSNVGNIAQFK